MKTKVVLTVVAAVLFVLAVLALPAAAKELPAQLPDPDGKAPDTTKPIKVYILAGQSNMCGMAAISGAKCHYQGVYLSADPDAPGTFAVWLARGNYRIMPHGIYLSADPGAAKGAADSIYKGKYDPAANYDTLTPEKTETIALGTSQGALPAIPGEHTHVVRACIDVPDSGTYSLYPGDGDSSYNVTELDGKEVYRKNVGEEAVHQKVDLVAGKRYPIRITYLKGGSTAFFLSRLDLSGKGDLETVTKKDKKFQNVVDDKGNWTVSNDVYYYDARISFKGSQLTAISNGKTVGPELQFGHIMGYFHDEEVLLIKTAMGNRALGYDFRPPSSGRTDPNSKWEGLEYRLMIEGVHKTLDDIKNIVPGYKGQGHEIAGFFWWQGHKDSFSPELIAEYEKNLVNLINDIRAEFKAPKMPVVVATVGFGGYNMSDKFLGILKAQMAVSDPARHPDFAGNVRSVDTRAFWREVDDSPGNADYHYNKNAETYMLVGDAAGRAMVDLIQGVKPAAGTTAEPAEPVKQPAASHPASRPADDKAARAALKPIIANVMIPEYIAKNRDALSSEASGEKGKKAVVFPTGALDGLAEYYKNAGVDEYGWHAFGPSRYDMKWHYYSFDPNEKKPLDAGGWRFRKVTYPEGMTNWFAADFDAEKAGWKTGLAPFGQVNGKLEPLGKCGTESICGCGVPPKTLWEKEVLLVRGTFRLPPARQGYRYRVLVGGGSHVKGGEGYAIYINGKQLIACPSGVSKNQGGQARGTFIDKDFVKDFQGGEVTIAATSFLNRSKDVPQGHFSIWMEEMKVPPLGR